MQRRTPYPPAVQGVAVLVLCAAFIGVFSSSVAAWAGIPERFWAFIAILSVQFLAVLFVPVRRLQPWWQVALLSVQVFATALAQTVIPTPLLDYVYLSIVLQAISLFRPWLWVPFAVAVWAVWNGQLLIASNSLLVWLQSNLGLAFPATCAIIAAIIYVRQLRRSEQAQHMLQQMQQRYDALALALREMQHRAVIEERGRLLQTVGSEMQTVLARAEQSVSTALGQAQSNVHATVQQTRVAAAQAIERLRSQITALRHGEPVPQRQALSGATTLVSGDEAVIGRVLNIVLTWVLPSIFAVLALALIALQHRLTSDLALPIVVLVALLFCTYVCTQLVHNPVLLQIGLAGQTFAVVVLALLTQLLPILLGMLLVFWQMGTRLTTTQITLFLAGVPATVILLIGRFYPVELELENLMVVAVAAVAVGGPLVLARRQFDRRKQAELRLVLLGAEIDQQTAEARALATAAERARLAREFHDDLGSQLMLINLQLQLAEELAEEEPTAALEQLTQSRELLHHAWRRVNTLADAELVTTGGTLAPDLATLVASRQHSVAGQVHLRIDGPLESLSDQAATTVYRTVQEGLTNALKHAAPHAVDVHVAVQGGYVTVTVRNDGVTDPTAPGPNSYGLIGLRERAEALGGGSEGVALPDGGWRLRTLLPIDEQGERS
jgi:signal transduction histidine kinase